jgi:hypothetical protein
MPRTTSDVLRDRQARRLRAKADAAREQTQTKLFRDERDRDHAEDGRGTLSNQDSRFTESPAQEVEDCAGTKPVASSDRQTTFLPYPVFSRSSKTTASSIDNFRVRDQVLNETDRSNVKDKREDFADQGSNIAKLHAKKPEDFANVDVVAATWRRPIPPMTEITRTRRSSSSESREQLTQKVIEKLSSKPRSPNTRENVSSLHNPKLLKTVEDAIRRLILPELKELKKEEAARGRKTASDGPRVVLGSQKEASTMIFAYGPLANDQKAMFEDAPKRPDAESQGVYGSTAAPLLSSVAAEKGPAYLKPPTQTADAQTAPIEAVAEPKRRKRRTYMTRGEKEQKKQSIEASINISPGNLYTKDALSTNSLVLDWGDYPNRRRTAIKKAVVSLKSKTPEELEATELLLTQLLEEADFFDIQSRAREVRRSGEIAVQGTPFAPAGEEISNAAVIIPTQTRFIDQSVREYIDVEEERQTVLSEDLEDGGARLSTISRSIFSET